MFAAMVDTSPNKTFPDLHDRVRGHGFGLLRDFSEACREEYFGLLGQGAVIFEERLGTIRRVWNPLLVA
jgi:hypothetical protein